MFQFSGVQGFGFRVSGFGFWVSGFGFRVSGTGYRVQGLGFGVQGIGLRFRVWVGCWGIKGAESRVSLQTCLITGLHYSNLNRVGLN